MRTTIFGRINWFDASSHRGCIISDDNVWYRIHEFTTIDVDHLEPNQRVEFQLVNSSIRPIVEAVRTRF